MWKDTRSEETLGWGDIYYPPYVPPEDKVICDNGSLRVEYSPTIPEKKKNEIASTFHKRRCAPTGMVAGSQEGRGERMKCIAIIDSAHSLMNFKLFGERGGAYRIDCDDAAARERENQYYTMVEKEDAESMLKWLIDWGVKELPHESVRWLFYYVLREEDKKDYGTDDYMIRYGLSSLPVYQKMDGGILATHLKNGEILRFIVDGEPRDVTINCNGYTMSILKHFLENVGKLQAFTLICQWEYFNNRLEKVSYPVVYKFQAPSPYLVKRYEQDDKMEWHLRSAEIEYGWFVNYQSILTTKGEQTWENDYTVKAELVREWSVWED